MKLESPFSETLNVEIIHDIFINFPYISKIRFLKILVFSKIKVFFKCCLNGSDIYFLVYHMKKNYFPYYIVLIKHIFQEKKLLVETCRYLNSNSEKICAKYIQIILRILKIIRCQKIRHIATPYLQQ